MIELTEVKLEEFTKNVLPTPELEEKEPPMAKSPTPKKEPLTQDQFEAALKSEPAVYDGIAIGLVPRKEGGFNLIKIAVDSKNLKAGAVEILDTAGGKLEATEKFKIAVVRNGII